MSDCEYIEHKKDNCKYCTKVNELEARNAVLVKALEDIKGHQEIVMGDEFNVKLSTTWKIADKALRSSKGTE